MREIEYTRDAQADLLEQWAYFYRRSARAAERFSETCADKFDQLKEFPNLGRERTEYAGGYRSVPVDKHLIFYRVTETKIIISRVVQGSRNLSEIFEPAENDTP